MDYDFEIKPLATIEAIDAYDYYESIRPGLGEDFFTEVEAFYQNLVANPTAYSYYDKPTRQGKIKRYPYVVIFEVEENKIIVYSIFNTNQNPSSKFSPR